MIRITSRTLIVWAVAFAALFAAYEATACTRTTLGGDCIESPPPAPYPPACPGILCD